MVQGVELEVVDSRMTFPADLIRVLNYSKTIQSVTIPSDIKRMRVPTTLADMTTIYVSWPSSFVTSPFGVPGSRKILPSNQTSHPDNSSLIASEAG